MLLADKKNEYWWYAALSILIFFSFYYAIGAYPLFDNNEGLYASIAKNMLLYKDLIIPHLNGVPYIEKPPLLYWLLSGSFTIFGFTAFAARLVTATSAALICVAILFFTKKIKQEQAGIIGALIFASSVGVSIIARMVYFDMLFTFLVSGALFCLFCWYDSKKTSLLRAGYLFFGLAILTKGLIAGIIIWGSFIPFLIIERDFRGIYKAFDPIGILLFLAVVLPWHIAAIIQHKGFFWTYIVEEHFLRFLDQREPHDYYHGPIYYYLPRMMIYLIPWSFFAPLLFWQPKELSYLERTFLKFNWCWLLVPLLFFSLSSAKANYYMIVSMPAVACLLGVKLIHLAKYHEKVFRIWSSIIFFIIALAFGVIFALVAIPKEISFSYSSALPSINYSTTITMTLPVFVFMVIRLVTAEWSRVFYTLGTVILFAVLLVVGIAAVIAVGILILMFLGSAYALIDFPQMAEISKSLIFSTIVYAIAAGMIALFVEKKPSIVISMISFLIIPLALVMVSGIKIVKDDISAAEAGIYLSEQAKESSLYLYQDFENISAVAFYAPNLFKMIDSKSSDLYYGQHLPEFKNRFLDKEGFLQEDLNEQAYVVTPFKKLEQFNSYISPLKFHFVKRFGDVIILSNK